MQLQWLIICKLFYQINTGISSDFFYALNIWKLIETSIIEYKKCMMKNLRMQLPISSMLFKESKNMI